MHCAAGRAAAISIATSFLLAALLVGYWYGFFRSCAVFPSALKYVGLVAFSVGIFSGPLLVLLCGAQILLNRGVSVRVHICTLVMAVILGVIGTESLILAQDLIVTRSHGANTAWHQRWFPFSFRKVGYNEAQGRYMCD